MRIRTYDEMPIIDGGLMVTKDLYGMVGFEAPTVSKRVKNILEGEQGTVKNMDLLQADGIIVLESLTLKNILGACAMMGSYDLKDTIKEELQKFFFEEVGFQSLSEDTKIIIKMYVVTIKMLKGPVSRDTDSDNKTGRIFKTVTKNIFNCKKEIGDKYIQLFDKNILKDFTYNEMDESISLQKD